MTTFPGSPRLLKGAIVGVKENILLSSIIVFQYNPDKMTRRLDPRATGGDNQGRVFFSINPVVTDFEHLWWATQLAVDTIMGINYDYFLGLEDEALECWSEQIWKGETQTGGD